MNAPLKDMPTESTVRHRDFPATAKELAAFDKLSDQAQKQCIRSVSRLFIFKGGRKEVVPRATISDCLSKVDPEFKKYTNAVLSQVQTLLLQSLGYRLVSAVDIKGLQDPKATDFYVTSALYSPSLATLLHAGRSAADSESSNDTYVALMHGVFMVLLTSVGRRSTAADLLRQLRKIDPRLPEAMPARASKQAVASCRLPGLGEDFLGLLERMRREGFLVAEKSEQEADDASRTTFIFGPRFHLEVGLLQLGQAYFGLIGETADNTYLASLREELDRGEE